MNSGDGFTQYNWKDDFHRFVRMIMHLDPMWLVAIVFLIPIFVVSACRRSGAASNFVVVYTSQDKIYAEKIFAEFTKETKIGVRAVFDNEAVKAVGLVNRLLAEKKHPQCDVFWNNEELRVRQLAAQDLFRETNGWAAFGYRSRRLVINTNKLSLAEAPKGWLELTNTQWRGKLVLSYPLFGTTATHFLALRHHWGIEGWRNWCRALVANKPMVVDGNSVAAKMVASGEALVGMTDSDDIAAENREGAHLLELPMTEETLLIPNTVGVIRSAPRPEHAQKFFEFLQKREVVEQLVAANALEGISIGDTRTLQPNWQLIIGDLDSATKELGEIFLR